MSKKDKKEKLFIEIGERMKEEPKGVKGKTATSKEYDDVVKAMLSKEKGYYPITIKGRNKATVKQALIKRIGGEKKPTTITNKLRVHEIKNTIYIEVR